MNGKASSGCSSTSPAWPIASQWLDPTPQLQRWWMTIGPQLSTLAHEAQSSIGQQFEVLLFLYTKVLPSVGQFYQPSETNWPSRYASIVTNDGSPIEYSWKWNGISESSTPEIRYCIEAIGPHTGTSDDPFNYLETKKLLVDELSHCVPQIELTWFHQFVKALSIDARELAPSNPDASPASMFLAFEHLATGIVVKAYFLPPTDKESGGIPTFQTFANAARGALVNTSALDAVLEYVRDDPVGLMLTPYMLAIDCVEPSQSRLKLYVSSKTASFASIVSVMTLGEKISKVDQGIQDLELLLQLVLGLESGFSWTDELSVQNPFDENLAHDFDQYGEIRYYFDVAPNSKLPVVKLYIPILRFAKSDATAASGLSEYLCLRKRDQYHSGFLRALANIGGRHAEGSGHRLQTYLAVAFESDGSLSITSYISPGLYHADIKVESSKN